MKGKRILTDEQKDVLRERMARAREVRANNIERARVVSQLIPDGPTNIQTIEPPNPERPAEVQAVIDGMDPVRKAKLQAIQGKVFMGDPQGQAALARHEAAKVAVPQAIGAGVTVPPRPGSYEVNLIVRNDGTCVSQHGPCVCGAAKREWHPICLKERGSVVSA